VAATSTKRGKVDRGKAVAFAVLLILIIALWHTWFIYPLKVLVVFFHELSHGLAALLTGGKLDHIELVAQEGGVCWTAGGSPFIVLSAGYLGSLLWGAGLLLAATRSRRDRTICTGLGILMLLAALLWVRPILSFGFPFTVLTGAALVAIGIKLHEDTSDFALKLIGLSSILYVPLDIISDTLARPGMPSDARMLGELTWIPGVVWGVLWVLLSVIIGAGALAIAVRPQPPGAESQSQ
jgi:hypothetical protein